MTEERGAERIRCRVIYSGRVQGVFFRATAQELSRGYAVVGFVRNLRAGGVELEAEGPLADVEAFLAAVADYYADHIQDAQRTSIPVRGDTTRFEIRY